MSSSGQADSVSIPFDLSKHLLSDVRALQRFVDANLLAFARCDIHGRFYEVNQACVEMFGYSKEELESGKIRWNEITPPEHTFADQGAIAELSLTGKAGPFPKEINHKNGARVPVLVGVVTLPDSKEEVLSYFINLSQEKLIETRLMLEESRFKLLAENLPQLVNVVTADGKVLYGNRKFIEYTGVTPTPESPSFWADCVHPGDRDLMTAIGQKAAQERTVFECQSRLRSHDGSYRWFLNLSTPIMRADGTIREWFATATDIDDKKRQEDEIRESEMRFRILADAIPQIVWSADAQGNFTFFNHRLSEFTGLSVEQSLDDAWTLLIHPEDLDTYMNEWQKALRTGDSYEVEFRLKRVMGMGKVTGNPYRWHLGRAVALRSSKGSIVEWFGTWTEIEPQKRRST